MMYSITTGSWCAWSTWTSCVAAPPRATVCATATRWTSCVCIYNDELYHYREAGVHGAHGQAVWLAPPRATVCANRYTLDELCVYI